MRGPFPPGMRSPHIIIIVVMTIIMIMIMIRPRHLVSPTLRSGGRGGRALAGLSPPPRPPLHLFRSPSPTHGWSSSWFSSETQPPITINKICTPHSAPTLHTNQPCYTSFGRHHHNKNNNGNRNYDNFAIFRPYPHHPTPPSPLLPTKAALPLP